MVPTELQIQSINIYGPNYLMALIINIHIGI